MKNQLPSRHNLAILGITIAICMVSCGPATQSPLPTEQELPPVPTSTPAVPTPTPAPTPTPCVPGFADPVIVFEYGPGTRFVDWAVSDFTADGLADIFVARGMFITAEDFPAYFFTNDGQGSFVDTTETTFAESAPRSRTPREIVLADFNGDGTMDIYIADQGSDDEPWPGYQNRLILSTPDGRLVDASENLPQQFDFTHSATVADIDGDGDFDIYAGNIYGAEGFPPQILVNDGQAGFSVATGLLPSAQTDMSVNKYTSSLFADLNNDGSPDLILGADSISRASAVLLNDGTGHFSLLPDAIPPKPQADDDIAVDIAAGDLNEDGFLDLAVSWTKHNYLGRYIQVLINQGNATFVDETQARIPSQVDLGDTVYWFKFIELTDADEDGDLDLLTQVNEEHAVYENDGTGVFEPSTTLLPMPSFGQYALADVNGDGHRDLVAAVRSVTEGFSSAFAVGMRIVCPESVTTPTPTATPISPTDACISDLASYSVLDSNGLKEFILQDILETFPELGLRGVPEEFFSETFVVGSPTWSPDEQQIAFSAGVGAAEQFINIGVFILQVGSSEIARLVPDGAAVEIRVRSLAANLGWNEDRTDEFLEVMGLVPWATNPVWSPDGQKIAFIFGLGDSRGEIWVISADGTGLVPLGSGKVEANGSWSPDSQQIIFTTRPFGRSNHIFRVDADGSELIQLTSEDAYYESVVWSPDGQQIAFVASPEQTYGIREFADIYVMNVDGSGLINLTSGLEIGAINPRWSPDGQQVLFNSVDYDYYTVRPDGSDLGTTTRGPAVDASNGFQCPLDP